MRRRDYLGIDPLLQKFAAEFRVVGGTRTVGARENTDMGVEHLIRAPVPVYWVAGAKVADNYTDFYDGSWDSINPVIQNGARGAIGMPVSGGRRSIRIATGATSQGFAISTHHLGYQEDGGRYSVNHDVVLRNSDGSVHESRVPFSAAQRSAQDSSHFYGISPIFKVKRSIKLSASASATEGAKRTLTVTTTGAHSVARTIKVRFIDDPGTDYVPAKLESLQSIEIKAGVTTTTFEFSTKVDPWTDKNGKFTVEISESFEGQPGDFDYGAGGKHSVAFAVTNEPDESHPTVSLTSEPPGGRTDYQEGVDPGVRFRVTLDKPWLHDAPLKVSVKVVDDETSNFLLPSEEQPKTVQFAKGSTSRNHEVPMIADGTKSSDGEITAEVVGASSTVRGPDADDPRELASHTVKILNNAAYDDRVVSVVDAKLIVAEGGQAVFALEVDRAPVAGATVTAQFITDAAELSSLLGRTVRAATPQTTRSPVAGADFTRSVGGTINWPSGKKRATLTIPIVDDMPYEGSEVFGVKFVNPYRVSFEGTSELFAFATINDDDDTPELTANSPSVKEGDNDRDSGKVRNTLDYEFTLSNTSTLPVRFLVRDTLTGTADSKDETDVDAVADATLEIPAGDTSVTHKVTINGDTDIEPDETVVLRLSQPRNATFPNGGRTLHATGTIENDDGVGEPRTVVRHVGPSTVVEGEKVRFRLEVIDSVSRKAVVLEKACTYRFVAIGQSAHWPDDFTPSVMDATIAKGSSSSDVFEYQTVKDETTEPDEVFRSGIDRTPPGCPKIGSDLTGYSFPNTTITEAPLLDIEDPAEKVTEGQALVFPVRLTSAQSSDVTIHWQTFDGSAKIAADYRGATSTITIKAGATEGTITVRTLQDKVDEPDQDFTVVIGAPGTGLTIRRGTATGVIRDDDARPDISIGDVTVTEGATASFTVELSAASEKEVTAAWVTQDGTAVARTDYEHASGAVSFAPGDTQASISVKTLDDARDEATETFKVSLFETPEGKRKIADATVTIEDNDDAALTFSVSDAHAVVDEVSAGSTATFTVTLSEEALAAVSVDWKTEDGADGAIGSGQRAARAKDGAASDYTAVPATTLTFAPGETEKQISVTVVDDEIPEGKEHFQVVLENPSGATIERSTGVAYIAPNDGVIYTVVNAGAEIREGQSFVARVRRNIATVEHTVRFCLRGVNSDNPGGSAVISNPDTDPRIRAPAPDNHFGKDDVRVTTRHDQLNNCLIRNEAVPWLITYPVGTYEKTVTIHTIDDSRLEDDETFTLSDGSGGSIYGGGDIGRTVVVNPSGLFTIIDDDSRRISVKARRSTVWEGEKAQFDIHLDPPLAQGETASVKYSTTDGTATGGPASQGHDYAAHTDSTLTLGPPQQAGGPAGTIEVQAHNEPVSESVYEQAETFTITLSKPSEDVNLPTAGAHVMQVTILDDDPTTVYADHAVADEGEAARVAIRLTHPRDADAEVTWKTSEIEGGAEAGKDFTAVSADKVTVPAGKTIVYVEVATLEDTLVEGDEAFEVVVTKVDLPDFIIGAARTVTIRDDDRHAPMFTGFADVSVEENEGWFADPTLEGEPDGVLTWTLEGDDAAVFRVNRRNGRLRLPAQNFEDPKDKDAKNTYEVTVRATDEDGNTGAEDLTVTVTDVRTIQVRPFENPGADEGKAVLFQVIRIGTTEHTTAATVKWRTLRDNEGDHPAAANDYTRKTSLQTFQLPAGRGTHPLSIETTKDDIDEEDETFIVELSNLTDGTTDDAVFVDTEGNIIPGPIEVVVTIRDDDTRGVTIDPVEVSIDEVDDPGTASDTENEAAYTVVLDSRPTGQVAIDLGVPDGAPFTVSPNKLTFKAKDWEKAQTVTVTAVDDTIDNPDGERTAEISHTLDAADTDYADETASAVNVTVVDDDDAPDSITLSVDTLIIAEDDDATTVTVTATVDGSSTFATDTTVKVEVGDSKDSAVAGTDYADVATFDITIDAKTTSGKETFSLEPIDNTVDANDKALSVIGTSTGLTVNPASIAITDDDDPPELSIDAPSVAEGANGATATLSFTVTLTSASSRVVTVDYAGQSGGTATSGGDYVALTAGTLTFAAGEVSKTIDVTVNGDDTDEPDETLRVRLSSPSNATLAGAVTTLDSTGTITDDDATSLILARTGSGSIAEDGVTIGYSTSDGRGNADDATYQVATSADYTAAPGNASLSIAEGASTGTISIATTDDDTYESDHYYTLTLDSTSLYNLSKADGAAIGTITDADDTPSFAFSAAATDADEDDGTVALDIAKTGETLVDATVSYATVNGSAAGSSDFTAIASTDLDFTAAQTSKTISVSLTDDSNDEPQEAFSVALTAKSHAKLGSTSSHTVNITDNDPTRVTLAAPAAAINENGGAKTITVTLGRTLTGDESLDVPLTFAGAATLGADYTLAAPSSVPTGVAYSNLANTDLAANPPTVSFFGVDSAASSATLILTAAADTVDEGASESVTVGLGTLDADSGANLDGGASGSGTATFNIRDDDTMPVATLKLTPTSIAEDGGATNGTSTVTASLSGTSNQDLTMTVAAAPVSPAVGGDYALSDNTTLTIAAGSTTSTGTVTITAKDNEVDAPNKTVTVSAKATGGNGVANPANATLTITDDDDRGIRVAPVTLTLAEADNPSTQSISEHQKTYTVELGSQPTGTVTVNLSSGDTTVATLSDNSLEFTASDWDAQTVTVTAVADAIDNAGDARTVRITHMVSAAGTDYKDETAEPVDVTVTDDDAAPSGITLTVDRSTIAEDAATATVKVTATVAGGTTYGTAITVEVEVGVDGDSAEAGTDYATVADFDIVIGAGEASAARTFSLNPTDDAFDEDSEALTVTGASGDIAITDAEITITDDDTRGISVSSVTLTLAEVDDPSTQSITEHQKTYTVELDSQPTGAVTVTDDDGEPTLSIDSPSVAEGDSSTATMTFKVTLSPVSGKPVSVAYADAATGTATSATDYAAISSGTLSFDAGQTEKTVVLRLSSPSNARLTGGSITLDGTGTITDDDDAPTVSVADATAVTEGDDPKATVNLSFTVTLDAVSGRAVTVPYTLDGTASAGDDYTEPDPLSVVIAAGSRSASIDIPVKGDTLDEPDETVTVTLGTPTNATVSKAEGGGAASGTINDDDAPPTVSVANAPAVNEGNDPNTTVNMSFTVSLSAASAKAITVPYTLTGTATGGSDYETPSSTSLSIAAGDSSGTIVIKVKGDTLDEPNETIIVTLGAPTNATVSTVEGAGTGTITDDDGTPTVTLKLSSASITENGGSSTVTASLSGASHQDVTLTVAAAAVSPAATGDYTLSANKTLTIAAGATESAGVVTVTATDNDVDAADKTVTVSATATGGGVSDPSAVTLTITDDDTRGVTVAGGPLTMDEADNTGTAATREDQDSYTVVLDSEPTDDVSINITAPAMVTLSPTSLTFTPSSWNQTQTVTATAVNDSIDNAGDARTGNITHAVVEGDSDYASVTAANVAVTVSDDDGEPTLSIDSPSVAEGDSATATLTFKVTLSPASGKPVSVTYADATTGTATSVTDYRAITSGTLNFAAGQTEKTVDVTVNGDTVDEPNETVVLRLSSPSNAALSGGAQTLNGTGTITDDDGTPTVTLELDPASIDESGNDNATTVTASLSSASHQAVTLTVAAAAVSPATANDYTLSGTTLTIAAGATSSTGTVTITAVDNDVDAPNKTVTVPATASGGGVANPDNQTLTITDDDDAPTGITLSVSPATLGEGDGETEITVTATVNGATRYVDAKTVTVSVGGGTAVSGTDYGAVSNFDITIAAAGTSQIGTFDLTPTDDTLQEEDETIEVTGSSGALTITAATVTITDNDATGPAGTVSLSASRYEVLEGDSLSVTVNLSQSPTADTEIELEATSPSGHTATRGTDYDGAVQTVTIRAGATSGKARISTTRDNRNDPNETFKVTIRASDLPGTVTLGEPHTAVVTIREPVSGITPPATATVEYAGRNSRIPVPVPAGMQGHGIDVAFFFDTRGGTARGGADCREEGTDLVVRGVFPDFIPGRVRNGPVLRIIEDINTNTIELDVVLCKGSVGKTFHAAWDTRSYLGDPDRGFPGVKSAPFNAGAAHCSSTARCLTQVTITGDTPDPDPEVTIAADSDITEGGDAVFTVQASSAPASDLKITLAIADDEVSDFLADGEEGSKTVTIAAGSETATYTLATTDDGLDEADGGVSATLEAGTGYQVGSPSTATVAVEDDDGAPSTGASLSVSPNKIMEADGDMTITVTATLDGAARTEVTVLTISVDPGTAQPDDFAEVEDFALTIPANAASGQATFVLSPVDDLTNEPEETVIVSGTSTIDGFTVTSATVVIRNEDPPASDLSLSVTPGRVGEDSGAQTITVTARFDRGTRSAATDVDISVSGNTATESDDFAAVPDFTITVPENQVSASRDFTFTPVQDALVEGSETITVSATTSVSDLQTHDATLTIEDATAPSNLIISVDDAEGVEGEFMRFRVHLSEPSPGGVRAKWLTHPADIQTADARIDYEHDDGEVVFAAGEQEKFVEVWLIEDDVNDPWETFQVWLIEPRGARLSDPVTEKPHPLIPTNTSKLCCEAEIATGRIYQKKPDPEPVQVSLTAARTSVAEGGSVRVTATLAEPLEAEWNTRIPLVYSNGTSESGDYEGPALVTIFFSSGDRTGWADIDIAEDADADDETFTVSFGELPRQVRAGESTSVKLTILDDDGESSGYAGLTISAADATAYEGREDLEFAVTLNRPAPGPVEVYHAITAGTARAGLDYVDSHGTLRFEAGERLKWATVFVEDDSIDEGRETLTLELRYPEPEEVSIARGEATGTIVNTDPMPKAWLARFGRAVAEQALDSITARIETVRESGRTPGFRGSIAGQSIGGEQAGGPEEPGQLEPPQMRGTGLDAAGAFGSQPAGFTGSPVSLNGATGLVGNQRAGIAAVAVSGMALGADAEMGGNAGLDYYPGGDWTPALQRLLFNSRFEYTREADEKGGTLGFWGRGAQNRFTGIDGDLNLDGQVHTAMLGADYARGDWIYGLVLSQSSGEGAYRDQQKDGGGIESTLTAAIPYAAWQVSERVSLWGAAGYGGGALRLNPGAGEQASLDAPISAPPAPPSILETLQANLGWAMAASGVRAELFGSGADGGPALSLLSDALWSQTTTSETDGMTAADAVVSRLRVGAAGSWTVTLGGSTVTPKLEVGLRHDGGDAETGFGVDLGGGLTWNAQQLGLSLDVEGRTLLVHEAEGRSERGFSAALNWGPGTESRFGPKFSLKQQFGGSSSGGLDALFSSEPIAGRALGQDGQARWSAETAWGMPILHKRFRAEPSLGYSISDIGREYSLGWLFEPLAEDASDLSLNIRLNRRESPMAPAEHGIGIATHGDLVAATP